jgi:hypothetical protein
MACNTPLHRRRKRTGTAVSPRTRTGYSTAVDEHPDPSAVARMAERARRLLRERVQDPELQQAVDQYSADLANGEPLGCAMEQLERALARVET